MKIGRLIYWSGIVLVGSLLILFVASPHTIGIGEEPALIDMRTRVMVDANGAPVNKGLELSEDYGCKFWVGQIKAVNLAKTSTEISYAGLTESIQEPKKFLADFESEKLRLETKLADVKRLQPDKGKPINLAESNIIAELNKLTAEKKRIEQTPLEFEERAVADSLRRIRQLSDLRDSLVNSHKECLQ
jgi:hypothetical protein